MKTKAATVITLSTSAAAGLAADTTTPIIVEWLERQSFTVTKILVADNQATQAFADALAKNPDLLISTGGTGMRSDDRTPEAVTALIDYEITGFGEEFRRRSIKTVPTALLSRTLAGVAGRTLVVALPGSPGAVDTGLELLATFLGHALDQLAGGGHGDR